MIYLDNAATSFPKPACVGEAMLYAHRNSANPGRGGHRLSIKSGEIVYNARSRIGELFSVQPELVIFTNNCTHSLNMAIKGSVKKGAHVIISSLEHNSVLRPVEKLRQMNLIDYDVAEVVPNDDDATVENFRRLMKKETTLVVCTHVSNVFGTVLPVERIGQLCREKGIRFVVDAAQSAGTFDYKLDESNIDILCLPGHKGLMGPLGTGILLLRNGVTLDSFIEGGTGSYSLDPSQPEIYPDRLESGTCNLPGIAGLAAGAEFVKRNKPENILAHERELMKILLEDLSVIKGVRVYDNMYSQESAPVVSFVLDSEHSESTASALDECCIAVRAGYHCSHLAHTYCKTEETGTVRISPGFFNSKKDIKYLIFCLNKIANDKKLC